MGLEGEGGWGYPAEGPSGVLVAAYSTCLFKGIDVPA